MSGQRNNSYETTSFVRQSENSENRQETSEENSKSSKTKYIALDLM